MRINRHYGELQDSYLFSTIARRVADYQQAHPAVSYTHLDVYKRQGLVSGALEFSLCGGA